MTRHTYGILAVFIFLLVLGISGCGKMGAPKPRSTDVEFSFTETKLTPIAQCFAVQGHTIGARRNVDRIDLEIAPVDNSGNCPTCPFNAREFAAFSLEEANYSVETGEFSFSYCPATEADMYRWRLVGRNVYSGLPYALTMPVIAIMPK